MTKSPTIKIQELQNGQLTVSIPKALSGALDLKKGDTMRWKLKAGTLYLVKAPD